ncbi:MAG TPA: CorA family divalent cation transporter [Candidatus Bathyarchaeia archaeon]|nr:CorA family divalent cation transporter [Candidatus Bathyarchaeia archaeon]
MKISTWEIGGKEGVREVASGDLALAPSSEGRPLWSELVDASGPELAQAAMALALDPDQREKLLDDARSNRISVVNGTLLLEFPRAVDLDRDPHPYVSCVARRERLVTVLRGDRRADRHGFIERIRHYLSENKAGIEFVFTQVLSDLIDETMEVAAHSRARTADLTTRVLHVPLDVSLEEIQSVMGEVQHLALIGEDQLFSLDALVAALGATGNFPRAVAELSQLRLQLSHILALTDRLAGGLRSLHSYASSARSDVDSAHLRTLTVVSAIFLPLNLIAGIYGMNFVHDAQHPWNMPELAWRYGYLGTLGLMACLAGTLLVGFRRRGWLGKPREEQSARPGGARPDSP